MLLAFAGSSLKNKKNDCRDISRFLQACNVKGLARFNPFELRSLKCAEYEEVEDNSRCVDVPIFIFVYSRTLNKFAD